jgi:photosystem II stability/assembly factor-like uncharacterized protein
MKNKSTLSWRQMEGPSVIFSIAPAGKDLWLIGSDAGLWSFREATDSEDARFESMSDALRAAAITAVAVTPSYPHEPLILVGSIDGIARSVDHGQTWASARLNQPSQVSQVVLSPNFETDGIAFAATLEDGVLRTSDHGRSWASWNFGLLDLETLALAVSPKYGQDENETVLAATGTGIFRSINGGRAWRELPFDEEALPPTGVAISQDVFVVSTESKGLFYSSDSGASWFKHTAFRGGGISALATSVDGSKLIAGAPSAIATSADVGKTWERIGRPPESAVCVALTAAGTILCGTQDEGLWIYP